MKNKGFTLVELLAVIAILGILLTLATTNVFGVLNKSKKGVSDYTRTQIEDAANLYATDTYCPYIDKNSVCEKTFTKTVAKDEIEENLGKYFPEMKDKCDIPYGASITVTQKAVNPENFEGGEVSVDIDDGIVCQK